MKSFSLFKGSHRLLLFLLFLVFFFQQSIVQAAEKEEIDVKEIVLGHMSDAYDWHFATWNGSHITIPLPVIVHSATTGWHVFSSARFHESEDGIYEGFFINKEANGKIFEKQANDTVEHPIDISITKNVVQIWIVVLLMSLIFIGTARWYRNKGTNSKAPSGFVGFIEMFVMSIVDDLIRPSVGERCYRKFTPILLTTFFFIFITNLLGLIPIFPGGANITGNINITLFFALCTMILVNLFGNKEYWKEVIWPPVPTWLKFPVPMMPIIEIFGIFTKPFALMVRLFANMMGGHAIILSLCSVIFITCQISAAIGTPLTFVSFVMMIFMNCLELLVAFIQAYVFTMLSAVFIGLSHPEHEDA